jgi:hypothetical protein
MKSFAASHSWIGTGRFLMIENANGSAAGGCRRRFGLAGFAGYKPVKG